MASADDHDIRVLNGLISVTLDSAEAYGEAARAALQAQDQSRLEQRSLERKRIAGDLQAAVRALGGAPEAEGSVLAKAQRAFQDVKRALLKDSAAGAAEAGDDLLSARYQRAIADQRVSATTRETVRRAHDAIRAAPEPASDL